MSAVTSLASRPRPGSLPAAPGALAAGSQTRLWLAAENFLAVSNDKGKNWKIVPHVQPAGWQPTLDVLNTNQVWLLAPGAGLWHTNDGLHWRTDGPLNTG